MKTETKVLLGLAAALGAYLLYKHEEGTQTVQLVVGQELNVSAKAGAMITVKPPAGYPAPALASGNLVASGTNSDGSVTFTAPTNLTPSIVGTTNGSDFASVQIQVAT
jgi:hypothetical protein